MEYLKWLWILLIIFSKILEILILVDIEENRVNYYKELLKKICEINSMELFAETFANMECGKPNELGEAMREFLKRKGIVWELNQILM